MPRPAVLPAWAQSRMYRSCRPAAIAAGAYSGCCGPAPVRHGSQGITTSRSCRPSSYSERNRPGPCPVSEDTVSQDWNHITGSRRRPRTCSARRIGATPPCGVGGEKPPSRKLPPSCEAAFLWGPLALWGTLSADVPLSGLGPRPLVQRELDQGDLRRRRHLEHDAPQTGAAHRDVLDAGERVALGDAIDGRLVGLTGRVDHHGAVRGRVRVGDAAGVI